MITSVEDQYVVMSINIIGCDDANQLHNYYVGWLIPRFRPLESSSVSYINSQQNRDVERFLKSMCCGSQNLDNARESCSACYVPCKESLDIGCVLLRDYTCAANDVTRTSS